MKKNMSLCLCVKKNVLTTSLLSRVFPPSHESSEKHGSFKNVKKSGYKKSLQSRKTTGKHPFVGVDGFEPPALCL